MATRVAHFDLRDLAMLEPEPFDNGLGAPAPRLRLRGPQKQNRRQYGGEERSHGIHLERERDGHRGCFKPSDPVFDCSEDSETMFRWINDPETVRFNAPFT